MRAEPLVKRFGCLEALKGVSLEVESRAGGVHHRAVRIGKNDVHPLHQPSREDRLRPCGGERPLDRVPQERNGKLVEDSERNIARQRAEIGMVFQRFNLFPHLTVLGNVSRPRRRSLGSDHGAKGGMALLERVDLGDKADTYPAKLSGGQHSASRSHVRLAMNPALMLFDEPTSALDPEWSARYWM